jgi:hypothetical protein
MDIADVATKGDQTPEHVNIMYTYIINVEKSEHLADIRMEIYF